MSSPAPTSSQSNTASGKRKESPDATDGDAPASKSRRLQAASENTNRKPRNSDIISVFQRTVLNDAQTFFAVHVATRNPYPHDIDLDNLVMSTWCEAYNKNISKASGDQRDEERVPSDRIQRLVLYISPDPCLTYSCKPAQPRSAGKQVMNEASSSVACANMSRPFLVSSISAMLSHNVVEVKTQQRLMSLQLPITVIVSSLSPRMTSTILSMRYSVPYRVRFSNV